MARGRGSSREQAELENRYHRSRHIELPRNFSKEFTRRARRLGFTGFTFHHLRGTHATLLLDHGVPVHIAAERIGDDPAVLLRSYAKRKRKTTANSSISADINALTAEFLGK
jgi:integrase